jgi:hypothetical protein
LAASKIPEFAGDSLFDILHNIAGSGKIPRGVAMPISRFLVSLAKSEVLFGSLRHSDASSLQLKRKREEADANERANKRLCISRHSLYVEVADAVRGISQTITTSQTLDPPVVSSIQPQLHRVFLFAVSSSATAGPNKNALQEISGLIQVLGVLSGIQIGQEPNAESQNILTAVHPCLVDGCGKFFSRLYSLRAHQRVHTEERPFRCDVCPATFARIQDQKRHRQLHDKIAWKCAGCDKVFPRRDAIKQHKTTSDGRQPKDECINAEIVEVQASVDGEVRSSDDAEEGELESDLISEIQTTVLGLHAPLQGHVARALGASSGQTLSSSDPTNGQATLASVIARAQLTQARRATTEGVATDASIPSAPVSAPPPPAENPGAASLSSYGLSDEQAKLLEEAIVNAATAAQAEAEAHAALEEEEEYDNEEGGSDDQPDPSSSSMPPPPP